jgi:dihydroorotate dehydrogenase
VGIGSGVQLRGINIFDKVNRELEDWLKDHDATLTDIRGVAHNTQPLQEKSQ